MSLELTISSVKDNLLKGLFPNEAAVSNGAVLPILNQLGWEVFNPSVVFPQFKVETQFKREKRFVDFALMRPNGNPCVFLEAKRVGGAAQGEVQLFEYAFHKGVPLVILTDGQEWHFYLPAEEGNYEERRAYKLDLLEREVTESLYRLSRYLSREAVISGSSLDSARTDYQDNSRRREIDRVLPEAWNKLLLEADESLLDTLAEKVEDLCGFRPDPEACNEFLLKLSGISNQGMTPSSVPLQQDSSSASLPSATVSTVHVEQRGFSLRGQFYPGRFAIDVLASIFDELAASDPTFPERFASRKHGRTRRYLAQNKYDLFPGNPSFADNHSRELRCGWFIDTNNGNAAKEKIIRLACEVAGLEFGRDIVVNLG